MGRPVALSAALTAALFCSCSAPATDAEPAAGRPIWWVCYENYPFGALHGTIGACIDGLRRPLAASLAGRPIDITDDGVVRFDVPDWITEGNHDFVVSEQFGDRKLSALVPFGLSFRRSGTYFWSYSMTECNSGTRTGFNTQCVGPFYTAGGLRRFCQDTFYDVYLAVEHFVPDPHFPRCASWGRKVAGLSFSDIVFSEVAVDEDKSVVVLATRRPDYKTAVHAGRPATWQPGEVLMEDVGELDVDFCGTTVWHGPVGTHLLVSDGSRIFASEWDSAHLIMGSPFSAPLPQGPRPCGLLAVDLDRDGNDELVITSVEHAGLAVLRGDPVAGFEIELETFSVGTPDPKLNIWQQHMASIGDVDGDGLLDIASTHRDVGVDLIVHDSDGALEDVSDILNSQLVDDRKSWAAATIASLEGQPHVIISFASPYPYKVFRFTSPRTVTREDWRLERLGPDAKYFPLNIFDVDGDGYNDVLSNDSFSRVSLWRRPEYEELDGLTGPRPLTEIPVESLPRVPARAADSSSLPARLP